MHATLTRADGATIHTRLELRPMRYSHAALGGPVTAEIAVTGDKNALSDVLTWLNCRVIIHNSAGLPVWWGLVQAAAVTLNGVEYALDASQVINRMAVLYVDEGSQAQVTAWVEDAHSVSLYGRREMRMSAQATNGTTALAQATRIVNERSAPLRSVAAGSGEDGATLRCVGYWRSLEWRYWSQSAGQIERDQEVNANELLGWAVTSDEIGFYKPLLRVGSLAADLAVLAKADRIEVSGSASNDDLYEVVAPDERQAVTSYTATTIYFDPSDDVHDSDALLNQFIPGDLLEISGATETNNNGDFWLKDMFQESSDGGFDHIRVHPGSIAAEAAGASVTIAAGNSVELAPRPALNEWPGSTITLASQATKIAMAVGIGSDQGELSEVWIQAARIGSPADNLVIEWCDATGSGGSPGAVLKSATVAGSSLPLLESLDWVQWSFDHGLVMAPGNYWLVVSRSGSADDAAYRVGLREAEGDFDTADVLLLYDGSAWISRTVASGLDAALALRIYAQRETTTQIEDIVTGVGDWLAATGVRTASGLRTRRYRSEEQAQTALSEVQELLAFGTSGGARLLARVTVDRVLQIDAAPSSADPGYTWTADGLRDRYGVRLPEGWLPVGEWVRFDVAGASGLFAPAFLEAAEYNVASGEVRPSFRAEQPIQTLARLAQESALPQLAARLRPLL